jgi:Ca-activated chloride channel family protein
MAKRFARKALGAVMVCLQLLGCATSPTGAPSQTGTPPRQCPKAQSAPGDLSKQANYRQVTLTAATRDSQPAARLAAKDLTLYQGNKQIPIVFFQPQLATVGILVDNSGSMEPKLPHARDALTAFIRDLNPTDEVFVDTFADRPKTLAPLSTVHNVATDHLAMMHAFGRTALYDVIIEGLQTVSQGCNQRKALLVLTDGMDTASSSSLDRVSKNAQSMKVPIYSIGIGDPNASWKIYPSGSGGTDLERVDMRTLNQLAEETGGRAYFVALKSSDNSLGQAVTAIARKIGNEYIVGFVGDGSTSQLRFEAVQHNHLSLKIDSSG